MATNNVESSKFLGYAEEAPPDNGVISSKFLGYGEYAPRQDAVDASKLVGWNPLAPTQSAVNAAKFVGYAILQTTTAYSLACNTGMYSFAGSPSGMLRGATITADNGVFALNGQSAIFSAPRNYYLLADPGFYKHTGGPAKFKKGKAWIQVECSPSPWVPVKKKSKR